MDRNPNGRIDVDGHPESTDRELNMQPGRLDDIESPEAYATRTGQRDVTGDMPGSSRGSEGERLHDREDMSGREGMAGAGGDADRVTPGEDIGRGIRARPADGLEGADGRVTPGEDIGSGQRARPANGLRDDDGRIERGEDLGNGIRARRADEQDPNNPLV